MGRGSECEIPPITKVSPEIETATLADTPVNAIHCVVQKLGRVGGQSRGSEPISPLCHAVVAKFLKGQAPQAIRR